MGLSSFLGFPWAFMSPRSLDIYNKSDSEDIGFVKETYYTKWWNVAKLHTIQVFILKYKISRINRKNFRTKEKNLITILFLKWF